MRKLNEVISIAESEPSPEGWAALCRAVDERSGPLQELALIAVADRVKQWPSELRVIGPDSPWLAGIFEGCIDRRLELASRATIKHRCELSYTDTGIRSAELLKVIEAFARRLDPTFDPPDVVLEQEEEIQYAYGCGGGYACEKRGSETQWVQYFNRATEHSADMENNESWTTSALANGASVCIDCRDYIGAEYDFSATGDVPAILEVAAAWQAVVRGTHLEDVLAIMKHTVMPWTLIKARA